MTEAEQISELKKELQQQQEQINALKASRINSWERVLIYGLIFLCAFPSTLVWMIYLGNRFDL